MPYPEPTGWRRPRRANRRRRLRRARPEACRPSWKANLAIDHELPWYGIVASAELLLTDVKDGIFYER